MGILKENHLKRTQIGASFWYNVLNEKSAELAKRYPRWRSLSFFHQGTHFFNVIIIFFFYTSPCGLTLVYVEADNEFYSLFYKNQTVLSLF